MPRYLAHSKGLNPSIAHSKEVSGEDQFLSISVRQSFSFLSKHSVEGIGIPRLRSV